MVMQLEQISEAYEELKFTVVESRSVNKAELIQERCSFMKKHMFRVKKFPVDISRTAYTLN
jgi:hypothetical protein